MFDLLYTVIRGYLAHSFVIFHAHVNAKAVIIRVQKNPKKNIKAQTILNTLRKKNIQNKNAKKMKKTKKNCPTKMSVRGYLAH